MKKANIRSWYDTPESIEQRTRLFEELIHPNINLVYKLSIRFTHNRQNIDENYNECLVNLFRYVHTYNPEKSLANWIFICCKRLIYDIDRKRAAFKTTDDINPENIVSHYSEDSASVSGNCMGLDNYRELYNDDILRAIDRLDPIHRDALLLQQSGYKHKEIMEIAYHNGSLKTPNMETIKSRLRLAKLKISRMIDRDGNSRER